MPLSIASRTSSTEVFIPSFWRMIEEVLATVLYEDCTSQAISERLFPALIGDYAWSVALAWTAAHTLSPVLAGIVLGAEMLPQALLVLVGGVLADRYDPRRMLVAGQVGQAAVLVLGALGVGLGSPRRARAARASRSRSAWPVA